VGQPMHGSFATRNSPGFTTVTSFKGVSQTSPDPGL